MSQPAWYSYICNVEIKTVVKYEYVYLLSGCVLGTDKHFLQSWQRKAFIFHVESKYSSQNIT